MFRRNSPVYVTALFCSDVVVAVCAWLGAYWLRFHVLPAGGWLPLTLDAGGQPIVSSPLLYARALPVVLALLWWSNRSCALYAPRRTGSIAAEVWDILRANVLLLVALAALMLFFARFSAYSRAVLVGFAGLNAAGACLVRMCGRLVMHRLRRGGHNQRRALIVGDRRMGQKLAQTLREHDWTGIQVVGFLSTDADRVGREHYGVPVRGTVSDLERMIGELDLDQIYLALPWTEVEEMRTVVDQLDQQTVDLRVVPDLPAALALNMRVDELAGLPLIALRESPLEGWGGLTKRAMDVTFSLLFLLIAALPMLLIALLVKLTSRGPILFGQERMGLDGETFRMWKFRSMVVDAEAQTGAVMASRDDPRRTPIGGFLRRTSLDELPQFFNVLLGNMSIVGPRPERPELIAKFRGEIPRYMLRLKVKAGITGWAQVNGLRGGDTSLARRIRYDLYYIRHWSVGFDLWIMLRTVGHVVTADAH